MAKANGGPAFARPKSPKGEYTDSEVPGSQTGMSLRDYFAAKAMAVSLMPVTGPTGTQWAGKDQLPRLAEFAYWVADAMLAERAK